MKKSLISIFLLLVLSQASVLKYDVDLDLPPQQRWTKIYQEQKETLLEFVQEIFSTFQIPEFIFALIRNFKSYLNHQDFIQELQGIADVLEIPIEKIILVNYIYELQTACTAITFQDKNGQLSLLKNLDYNFAPLMKKTQAQISFYRKGKLLIIADVSLGTIGIVSGVRQNAFAITLNERDFSSKLGYIEIIYGLIRNRYPAIWALRESLEKFNDYSSAVDYISKVPLISLGYFTLAGTQLNEGTVITRGVVTVDNVASLNGTSTWFLVQTNYDRDLPDPKSDYRRIPAEEKMEKIGFSNASDENVFDIVLSQPPNKQPNNADYPTIATVQMIPSTGYFNLTMYEDNGFKKKITLIDK